MSSTKISNRKRARASGTSREESTAIAIRARTSATVVVSVASSGFESLVDDTLDLVRQFLGKRSYGSYGGINKRCREVFLSKNLPKETFFCGYAPFSMIQDKAGYNDYRLAQAAVAYNRNDILQWLLEKRETPIVVKAFDIAAGVSLNTLKRVKNDVGDYAFTTMKIYEDWHVSDTATSGERLDVLNWLKGKGWFDPSKIVTGIGTAAKKGNIPVLEWLMENGCPLDHYVFFGAAEGGHLNMLEFLKKQNCPLDPHYCLCSAAFGGNLESIQWFLRNGCSIDDVDERVICCAAGEGHLHVMKFFVENGYSINDIDENSISDAVQGGHLNVLQWLHENNCPIYDWIFACAAGNGNIDNLQWLLENNYPWDKFCYKYAALSNKLEVLEWLKEKGCPRGDNILVVRMNYVSSEAKDWLLENGFTLEDEDEDDNTRYDHE